MLFQGEGVERDDREAMRWYRKAADQGFLLSIHNIVLFYLRGRGVETNVDEAIRWFSKAADQNLLESQQIWRPSMRRRICLGQTGLERGLLNGCRRRRPTLSWAEFGLNTVMRTDMGGQNEAESLRWLRACGRTGLASSQSYLGSKLKLGDA